VSESFNPLDMDNLSLSILNRMELTAPTPLAHVPRFSGAGLYAIYYTGAHSAYALLAKENRDGAFAEPIYVGKAVPRGGRRGVGATLTTGTPLSSRLKQHAASVAAAENLDIEDFWARWLVMDDIWIPLGESALLRRHQPVWNAMLDGFGNHDPGGGRRQGKRSVWDTLHPGRSWAVFFADNGQVASQIEQELAEYLRARLA
jgi:Eco29kI restriction endonuclease